VSERPFSSWFLRSAAGKEPLRVGVILDGPWIARASASVLRDMQAAEFASLELVILEGDQRDAPQRRFDRLRAAGGLAFAAYATLDLRLAGSRDDPFALEDVREIVAGIPTLAAGNVGEGAAWWSVEQVDRIRAAGLDVIVHLGSRAHRFPVIALSRHGVWSLSHGDLVRYRAGPAAYWELSDRNPTTSVELRCLDDRAGDIVLDRATFATDPTSLARTRRTAAHGSAHLVVRNLRLLHERGWSWLQEHRPLADAATPGKPRDRPPNALDVVAWFGPLATRRLAGRLMRLIRRQDQVLHWRMAIRMGHPSRLFDRPDDVAGFRWIESPPGHFYADPFIVERDERRWLFFEDFRYEHGKAVIACAEVGPDGALGDPHEIVAGPGHLSYPMVVLDGSEALLVPESSEAGVVRLYRATAFPESWSAVADLLPEPAVDSTLWRDGGRWWLFTTLAESRGGAGMLMLFHADRATGPWTPHPLNPISQDVRTSRGAGSLFRDGDRLIRPSQDGSRGYGYRLTFNEVTLLSETEYAERPGPSVTPERIPGLLGIHTYNRAGDVEVIDGKVARSRRSVA
jgi:hypothetical protein